MYRLVLVSLAFILLSAYATPCRADTPSQPLTRAWAAGATTQMAASGVRKQMIGSGRNAVFIFTPEAPTSPQTPVIAFIHGDGGKNPYDYGGWIDHLVRSGYIVLYPVFQESGRDAAESDIQNMFSGLRAGFAAVGHQGGNFAVVGHSIGGGLSLQVAVNAARYGLPVPQAVMLVQPGTGAIKFDPGMVQAVSPATLLLCIEGEDDQFKSSRNGWEIFRQATQIPPDQRAYVLLLSGQASHQLIADHYAPLSPLAAYDLLQQTARQERRERFVRSMMHVRGGEIDEMDTMALWPLFDALAADAFRGGRSIRHVLSEAGIRAAIPAGTAPALSLQVGGR